MHCLVLSHELLLSGGQLATQSTLTLLEAGLRGGVRSVHATSCLQLVELDVVKSAASFTVRHVGVGRGLLDGRLLGGCLGREALS